MLTKEAHSNPVSLSGALQTRLARRFHAGFLAVRVRQLPSPRNRERCANFQTWCSRSVDTPIYALIDEGVGEAARVDSPVRQHGGYLDADRARTTTGSAAHHLRMPTGTGDTETQTPGCISSGTAGLGWSDGSNSQTDIPRSAGNTGPRANEHQ